MSRINFNPITFSLEITSINYPDLKYNFNWVYLENPEVCSEHYAGPWGAVNFDGDIPTVEIDPRLPIERFPEIFLHEIAHLVVGYEEDHNEVWEKEFEKLEESYNTIGNQRFNTDEVKPYVPPKNPYKSEAIRKIRATIKELEDAGELIVPKLDFSELKTFEEKYTILRKAVIELRQAQIAYMQNRGNDELGKKVAEAANEIDILLNKEIP